MAPPADTRTRTSRPRLSHSRLWPGRLVRRPSRSELYEPPALSDVGRLALSYVVVTVGLAPTWTLERFAVSCQPYEVVVASRVNPLRRASGSYVYVVVPFVGSPVIVLASVRVWPARLR